MKKKKTINRLTDFIQEIASIQNQDSSIKDGCHSFYYRGENKDYGNKKCLPAVIRTAGVEEKDMYYDVLRSQPEEFKGLSNLDILAKMQHYSIPTRLLDVTTNPLIALFFACFGELKDEDGHVYIFKTPKDYELTFDSDRALLLSTLPKLSKDQKESMKLMLQDSKFNIIGPKQIKVETEADELYETKKAFGKFIYECERERDAFRDHHVDKEHLSSVFFVKPQYSSKRMELQSSLFMEFGISNDTNIDDASFFKKKLFEQKLNDLSKNNIEIIDITVLNESKQIILNELKSICGISYPSIFGDLESMSKCLKK